MPPPAGRVGRGTPAGRGLISTIGIWNQLPQNVRNLPAKKFKQEITNIFGVSPPPLYYSLGSKKENYLLTRLRLGMSNLNSHLFSVQAVPSPNCICGNTRESTAHYLLHCPRYHTERQALINDLTQVTNKNIENCNTSEKLNIILYSENLDDTRSRSVARCIFKYIKQTKRFNV